MELGNKERSEDQKIVIGGIKECSSPEAVHSLFRKYRIENDALKIELLNEAMGSPQTFYSSEPIDDKLKVEREISILMVGRWRNSKFFQPPNE